MITHKQFWQAIDKMASEAKMSRSKMAIKTGLDATALNKGNEINRTTGKEHWLSFQTVNKLCETCGISLKHFIELTGE